MAPEIVNWTLFVLIVLVAVWVGMFAMAVARLVSILSDHLPEFAAAVVGAALLWYGGVRLTR